jgi:receptor-type tyrosine-protein phosphatase gamma
VHNFTFHFSAGVGRTGAYILIDAMLKQMRAKGELNLVAYLKHIRTQRNYLVQTEEQYIFVHDALAEAVASGETNINKSYLSRYINSLQSSFTTDENSIPWQLLDRQFKLSTGYRPQESQFVAALKPFNQSKNQNFDFLPIESARVALAAKPGIEGSDYINASWLPGFNQLKEFVITQHPTEQTVPDFWQMLWDHNARTVVVLSALQQPVRPPTALLPVRPPMHQTLKLLPFSFQEFGIFWPRHQMDIDLDSIRVKLTDESESGGYQTKDFNLISLHDDYELNVRLIFCPSWPHHCSPLATCTDLIRIVQSAHANRSSSGPLVVVDRYGGTEAATFAALSTLLRQLDFESHVDVYQYAKVSHNRRPGIWKSQDDYLYLYRVTEAVCFEMEKKQKGTTSSANSVSPSRRVVVQQQFQHKQPYTNGHCSNGHANGLPSFTTVRIPPDGSEAGGIASSGLSVAQHHG